MNGVLCVVQCALVEKMTRVTECLSSVVELDAHQRTSGGVSSGRGFSGGGASGGGVSEGLANEAEPIFTNYTANDFCMCPKVFDCCAKIKSGHVKN